MEYLSFSQLDENDFDEVVSLCGGQRYTTDPSVQELNCDYLIEDVVVELKIVEEEPIGKVTKQGKLAELFRSDIKTVILNPLDLDAEGKRTYYRILASPIKSHLKKASKQLKTSADSTGAKVKIAIIMNNGLTMTSPEEFENISVERARNDTSGIDILIVCGMYYLSDKFDSIAIFGFKDFQIRGESRPQLVQLLRTKWFEKVNEYMTKQITDLNIKRTKEPIQDLFFELNGIRYVKPTIPFGHPSDFYGKCGRPREDTTGMTYCPKIAQILPSFDDDAYLFARKNVIDNYVLEDSLKDYLIWAERERTQCCDPFKPVVLMHTTMQELAELSAPFYFDQISEILLSRFQEKVLSLAENSINYPEHPVSLNYILVQVNEIGMDKANDIACISHNLDATEPPIQNFIIKGERMKYEYAIILGAAHCMSIGADVVYHYRDENHKWQ